MRRVLMLNYEFPPLGGGAANATFFLLKEFAKHPEFEIDLVTSSVDSFKKEQVAPNITVHYLDIGKKGNLHYQSMLNLLRYSAATFSYSRKLMRQREFDLCHTFFGIPCGYVAMKLGLPYIVSLRGSDVPFYNQRFYWLDKLLFQRLSRRVWRRAKAVVANAQKLKELALASAPTQKIGVIPNGVDTDFFHPDTRHPRTLRHSREGGNPEIPLKLVSTGRLIARKGYDYLLEAMVGRNVTLTAVGDGNLMDHLKAKADALGVKADFVGPKPHKEVIAALQEADAFVLPSLNEGMSNSILEAMACGLPIIATDTGGTDELVTEGENGLIVPKADAAALATALDELLTNPNRLPTMAVDSRRRAEQMSWPAAAEHYLKTYELA